MHPDQWDINGLKGQLASQFGIDLEKEGIDLNTLNRHELGETLFERLKEKYEMKEAILGKDQMRYHERMVMLSVLDGLWKDHLLSMDHLKEGIGLRGYGQQDPLVAYKKESFDMFEAMMGRFQEDTVRFLFLMQIFGPDGQPITQLPAQAGARDLARIRSSGSFSGWPSGHGGRQWCSSYPRSNAGAAAVRACSGPGTGAFDHHRRPGAGVSTQEETRARTSQDGRR